MGKLTTETAKIQLASQTLKVEEIPIEKEVTKDEYEESKLILEKVEKAKERIKKFEDQERFETDPIADIIVKGEMKYIEGEQVRDSTLFRATKIHYITEKGTVERIVSYQNDSKSNALMALKEDKSILL